ncbi:MAG: pirin family protein [Ignavibacteria bacterium]|nr:pirin family protein [Ignavibacteria bacterium]
MKTTIHRADSRGYADHGWLKATHTFSFASYYDPSRTRFGLLRVLNDDVVESGMGFGTHPHDNMEIVTIPIEGELAHKDSMGHEEVIRPGEVQNMSAGKGITHSEYNASREKQVNLLQVWVFPKEKDIEPRFDQKVFSEEGKQNRFQVVVSPVKSDETLWINQDSVFALAKISKGNEVRYDRMFKDNGVYLFVIDGSVNVWGETLGKRDGAGLEGSDEIIVKANEDSYVLAIEVPMR